MKVLLDENMPHQLRAHLTNHETSTVAYLGWGGLKNGTLLDQAEQSGFDILVTGDLSLEYQQNLSARKVAIVSLSSHNWRIIKPHVAQIASSVDAAQPGTLARVECGRFTRSKREPPAPSPR